MTKVISELVYSIAETANSTVPAVPTPEHINLEELAKALGKKSPDELVFDTRPIGKVTESRNGRNYSEESVRSLVEQVKIKLPEGRWGHLAENEAATRYELPAVRWVNAVYQESDQTAYGKLIALTEEAERHILSAKVLNAKLGTSIYAHSPIIENKKVKGYDLVTIDLANAERVGIYDMNSVPNVTREMENSNNGENVMPEDKNKPVENGGSALITETADVKGLRATVLVQETELGTLRPIKETFETVAELLGVKQDEVLNSVRSLREQNRTQSAEIAALLETTIDLEVSNVVKVETAQPFVREFVVNAKPANREAVKDAVKKAVEVPHIKKLIESAVVTESGGNVTNGGSVTENRNDAKSIFE